MAEVFTAEKNMDIILKLRKAEKDGNTRLVSYYKEQLVIGNEFLIQKQINKVGGLNFESLRADMAQEGRIALIEALEKYDENSGVGFTTFIVPKIRGAMLRSTRCFQSPVSIPHNVQELRQKIYRYSRDHIAEHGKSPSITQISEYFEQPQDKILSIIGSLVPSVGIDSEDSNASDGTSSSLHEVLFQDTDRMSLLDFDEEIVKKVLDEIEENYSKPHRIIIEHEFGFNGAEKKTIREISRDYQHLLYVTTKSGKTKFIARTTVHLYSHQAKEAFVKLYAKHVRFCVI